MEDPFAILKDLKEMNCDRPVIAHLNINSLSSKFEPLTEMVKDSIISYWLQKLNLIMHFQWDNFK